MGSRQALLVVVLAIFVVGLTACSSNSDEPDSTATTV